MNIENIKILTSNPFICSRYINSFLTGYEKNECSILLTYLVLPFIFYQPARNILNNLQRNQDTLPNLIKNNSEIVAGLQYRIYNFKPLTSQSLIVANNENKIELSDFIVLKEKMNYNNENEYFKQYSKAAYYLGILFSEENKPANVFKHLKVLP